MRSGGDFKNKDLHPEFFDRGRFRHYYTRPMAAGSPDLVDSVRLAEDGTLLRRAYELRDLPRLKGLLANPSGLLEASFAFSKAPSGRPGAHVEVHASPALRCQRCLRGFALPIDGGSDVEFASEEAAAEASNTERELYRSEGDRISLRDLAEEELLLALPLIPVCSAPARCGNAPGETLDAPAQTSDEVRRPFSALQDLLKKT
jgi:uncharacterized protein